jgi:hypothetical protein
MNESNVIVQFNEIVHISIRNPQTLSLSEQEMALTFLNKKLEYMYENAELTITRDKYNVLTDISIQFSNIEDATHFKLTYAKTG